MIQDLDIGVVEGPSSRGRITIYCVAETLDRVLLQRKLEERGGRFLLHKCDLLPMVELLPSHLGILAYLPLSGATFSLVLKSV